MRGFKAALFCATGIAVGASIGPGVLDGDSVLNRLYQVAQAKNGRSDSINLPAGGGSLISIDGISLTYPGGNEILAVRTGSLPPVRGYFASSMTLFYRFEAGNMQLGCGGQYHSPQALILERIDIGADAQPITLNFKSGQTDASVPATLARKTDGPTPIADHLRLITVEGDDVLKMLAVLAGAEFPSKIAMSFSAAGGTAVLLDDIPTTGAVQPAIDSEHRHFAQPLSDPLQVAETFCRVRPS